MLMGAEVFWVVQMQVEMCSNAGCIGCSKHFNCSLCGSYYLLL